MGAGHTHKRTALVTIASGASLSGAVQLGDGVLAGILMPAAWTAAALTFEGSMDGSTFKPIYDDVGVEIQFTVDADRVVIVAPYDFSALKFMKVRSGTLAAGVNQAAERILQLLMRQI